ncbi:MAG: DNA polymerase III subunit alpha [Candidatus Omnitrophica bacterium]|nr:DNA polymerase III subunit alpha [Candidatus Omnitrophota bacterium]
MPHSEFVHLHLHTQYSLLDGACRIRDILSLARQYKMDSLAITDHGNMFGAIEFYLEARKAGIKPIIGCEVYVAPKGRLEKTGSGIDDAAYHLILLARDETGYHNLMKLVSIGYLEGFYYRPRIDKEVLSSHRDGLIGLSACLKGEIPQMLQQRRFNDALKSADEYMHILGKDNFYLEIQANGIPEQIAVNDGLVKISNELRLPLVATNDVHYLNRDDARSQEALLCIQTQSTLDDPNHMRFQTDEFYFKSPEQMKALFGQYHEALKNSLEIAGRCNLELDFSKIHLPKFEPPKGKSKDGFLKELCEQGLSKRYEKIEDHIRERLDHELSMIKEMGFTSYFLIVYDFIHYAKKQGIPVGPGRGSAAGSLVSYLLEITDIDPLKYGLLFERFLNPERLGLPDIDIDFCYERRQEVIDYVTNKYGRENVAQVITFGTMQARAVIRDVGRVMGISYAEVDRIAKMIPTDLGTSLKSALSSEAELNNLYKNDKQVNELMNTALSLEGLNRHASIHAAGVVIADKPLNNYMPLFKSGDNQITTGYSMSVLEKIGLLKVDFLGLRTLTVIEQAVKIIKETKGKDIDIEKVSLDDPATYKLLAAARTIGVFQVESSGMRDLLKKLVPEAFEDLIALLALYRPGPIGSGMLDDFIKRKHNLVPIRYEHPSLEPILKGTYGIMVYQEQIMQIASTLAGFSLAQADLLRKAMGKKIPEVMEKERKNFILGCAKNTIRESTATKIFDLIEYFSGYGFNKCLVGSSEIIDADSGKTISVDELFDQPGIVKSTLSIDDRLKFIKTRIKDVVYNGMKPVYRITTSLGRKIAATSNHPFFAFRGWKNLGDLKIGERIGLCRRVHLEESLSWQPHKVIALAGIISEGNTCHPSGVYYYNNDRLQVEDFVQNVNKFENTIARISERRGRFEVYVGTGRNTKFIRGQRPWNKQFISKNDDAGVKLCTHEKCGVRLWIEELGLDYKKADEKFIPADIFRLDDAQLGLFIGRLWTGDGFIFSKNNTIPFYASSSYRLSQQLQDLLLRFGIVSKITEKQFRYVYKGKSCSRQGYALYLFGYESVSNFIQKISPFIVSRSNQISALREYYRNVQPNLESKDTLPAEIKYIIKEEKEKIGLTWKELEKKSGVCMKEFYGRIKSYKKGFRRGTILKLAEFFESERLLRLVNSDIVWDSVVSIDYVGREKTYDLEIEGVHNFFANGFIVHNSHSSAYAMISYRTAYLKANFPVEFMCALLTSERDNTDKIVEYVAEAERMGINILPPDINESTALFKVIDELTIRFGLLAVKNVGGGAVESIVEARKDGKFKTLQDLCSRIDLRLVNKKVLESLIKCGALDFFGLPRAQMVAGLGMVLEASSRAQRDRLKGQFSFFDQGAGGDGFKSQVDNLPQVREWPEPQVLAFEKEMLGFYVTGHPLARYAGSLKRFASTSIAKLATHRDEEEIKIVAFIAKVKHTLTRARQEKMAILKLEDLEGVVEALVFPRVYQKVSRCVLINTVVLISGTLNLKEETPKILINDMMSVDQIYRSISSVNINLSGLQENIFESLKEILSASVGRTPIYLHLHTPAKSRVQLLVGENYFVSPSEELILDIENLIGHDRLSLVI